MSHFIILFQNPIATWLPIVPKLFTLLVWPEVKWYRVSAPSHSSFQARYPTPAPAWRRRETSTWWIHGSCRYSFVARHRSMNGKSIVSPQWRWPLTN